MLPVESGAPSLALGPSPELGTRPSARARGQDAVLRRGGESMAGKANNLKVVTVETIVEGLRRLRDLSGLSRVKSGA